MGTAGRGDGTWTDGNGSGKWQLQTPAEPKGEGGTELSETPAVPQPSHPWALPAPAPARCPFPAAQGSSSHAEAVPPLGG